MSAPSVSAAVYAAVSVPAVSAVGLRLAVVSHCLSVFVVTARPPLSVVRTPSCEFSVDVVERSFDDVEFVLYLMTPPDGTRS
ncbi:hypothetical protein C8039_06170 [Halogeometricum sp. wsp3]|nr:hypothetical protein C8039_06170 [Halogeometricum sp. wsp3]